MIRARPSADIPYFFFLFVLGFGSAAGCLPLPIAPRFSKSPPDSTDFNSASRAAICSLSRRACRSRSSAVFGIYEESRNTPSAQCVKYVMLHLGKSPAPSCVRTGSAVPTMNILAHWAHLSKRVALERRPIPPRRCCQENTSRPVLFSSGGASRSQFPCRG